MNLADLLEGLRRGDAHDDGIRCLRLFRVEGPTFASLCDEISRFRTEHQPADVGDPLHVSNWVDPRGTVHQHSLLTRTGRADDSSADHDHSTRGKWFFESARYPVVGALIADLPDLINFRINTLGAGAALSAHEEHVPFRTDAGTIGARVRFHLPLQTNPGAELTLDGNVCHLEAGVVHLVNHGCVHDARNLGTACRVHLVWDALLTSRVASFIIGGGVEPPPYLVRLTATPPPTIRVLSSGPPRRLLPDVTAYETAALSICDPQ